MQIDQEDGPGILGPPRGVARTGNSNLDGPDFSVRARRCLFQGRLK